VLFSANIELFCKFVKQKREIMKNLKTCVVIAAELITSIGKVVEDKKVQFSEILGLAPELFKIPKLVSNLDEAILELKTGISPEYANEIKSEVAAKLKLDNAKAEIIVEATISWLLITSSTVKQTISQLKK
jgi:hypothetical protein